MKLCARCHKIRGLISHRQIESSSPEADFSYIRWLGDRKKIEAETTTWDRVIIDRRDEMKRWIPVVRELLGDDIGAVYAFFNNHYAGHAPGSIALLEKMWKAATRG